jgi:hypothetical protein
MKKYIYFSKKVRKNRKKVEELITDDNEGFFWYLHINNITKLEVVYYNNKNGILIQRTLSTQEIQNEVLSNLTYTENEYIEVIDKSYDKICVIKINNLIEYIEIVDIINDSSDYVFRGQKNKEWSLTASVFRNNYDHQKEYNLYKEIKKNQFKEFTKENFIDNLIHMQHYGIPTRLLDWSRNPLIPLFFACSESRADGRVFAYKPKVIFEFDSKEYNEIAKYFEEDINLSKLSSISIKFLVSVFRKSLPQSIFIESSYENDRLRAQNGLFSIYIDIRPQYIDLIRDEIIRSTNFYTKFLKEMDSTVIKTLAQSNEEDMRSNLLSMGRIIVNKDVFVDNDINMFINELTNINYWNMESKSYETNLSAESIDLIIPFERKMVLRKQLEKFNINSMTVYPDFSGFVQYINDKYERKG